MTVAMRPVVQRSVSNFQVVAPRRRRRGSCRCCAAVNFDGRPGAGLAVKALRPRRRTASRQRITELCEHPSRRATSVTDAPAFSSSIPRRRRRSSSSGLPCGRMPRAYRVRHQMSITYAHINNDMRSVRQVVTDILECAGATVTAVDSAEDALEVLQRERPNVLLSDLSMPEGQDGYWLIGQVRALPPERGGTTPAAALTAYTGPEHRASVLRAGFQYHVAKPVSMQELLGVVAILALKE